jgi:hypothetical protein
MKREKYHNLALKKSEYIHSFTFIHSGQNECVLGTKNENETRAKNTFLKIKPLNRIYSMVHRGQNILKRQKIVAEA